MDLVNDEESSFAREMAEAIARESHVLALLPERQEELLAHLRATVKETAQWPDFKRPIVKWIETPPAQREPVKLTTDSAETGNETHTESGCTRAAETKPIAFFPIRWQPCAMRRALVFWVLLWISTSTNCHMLFMSVQKWKKPAPMSALPPVETVPPHARYSGLFKGSNYRPY